MDQPGPGVAMTALRRPRRPKKVDSRLIVVKGAQPPLYRVAWTFVTLVAWLSYVHLWLPLATALMWWLGLRDAYEELYRQGSRIDTFVVLALPVTAVLVACVLIGWAEYNRLRFTGNERRARLPDVPMDDIAIALGAAPGVPAALARTRIAILDMDDAARPVAVVPVLMGDAAPDSLPSR